MPKLETYDLRPTGWETDPEEYFPLSTLDYLSAQLWCSYALFFKLPASSTTPESKSKLVSALGQALERTFSQARQLPAVLVNDPSSTGLAWHRKRTDTVPFHVQHLDGPEDAGRYPTLADLEARHFVAKALGDPKTWSVPGFRTGECPEARVAARPKAAAYKATFVPGGLTHQLAENCAAIWSSSSGTAGCPPAFPSWDPACLDLFRVTKPNLPEDQQADGPASPSRHQDHRPYQRLLFHLPNSKIAQLKRLACPPDDGTGRWISSYDAFMAQIWWVLSKHKARLYSPPAEQPLIWGEAVNMRKRFRDSPMPERVQSNVVFAAVSIRSEVPQPTAEEVISEAPLWKLAWYVRQLTNLVTEEYLDAALAAVAPVRDKTTLFFRTDALPPTGSLSTDWRDSRPCEADFGFARPYAFRWPFDNVMNNMWITCPKRVNGPPAGDDEGNELSIPVEKELVEGLLADPEWNEFFEFRGMELDEEELDATGPPVEVVNENMRAETEHRVVVEAVAVM